MRILIAPDSFKESMTAAEAAAAMARGVARVLPDAEVVLRPLADGGEGTLAVLAGPMAAELRTVATVDALGRPISARFGLAGRTAIIEVAEVIGLGLIPADQRDIMRSSTAGLAALVMAALDAGADRLIFGIGGTATCEGGAGLLAGLGARLLDGDGQEVTGDPAGLGRLSRVEVAGLDPRLAQVHLEVATDVTNPLLGPDGAAPVFAPQKGARADQVPGLADGLTRWAAALHAAGAPDVAQLPGGGAAGGLGAALLALGAQLRSGAVLVADAVGLAEQLAAADLVLTGEGSLDAQTASGKTVSLVVTAARVHQVPVLAFAGRVADADWATFGLAGAIAVTPPSLPLVDALASGPALLEQAVAEALRARR
ncbi:MAG: glycerate kinase [Propionibacteriales bacterium]|nr:glycerate kinase [Propionibacteriales bacterium]